MERPPRITEPGMVYLLLKRRTMKTEDEPLKYETVTIVFKEKR
jgi:hypothetical protein